MDPEGRFDGSMGSLDHTIRLRVVGTGRSRRDPQVGAQGGEQGGHELGPPI